MLFSIDSRLLYRFAEPCEVLLLVEAAHSQDQIVHAERLVISPDAAIARPDDPGTGERRVVFTAHGDVDILYQARVEVPPRDLDYASQPATPIRDLPQEVLPFLRPSRYCPSDRLEGFVKREFGDLRGGAMAAAISAWVQKNLQYRAGASTAATTALETFLDGAGVCRDFTHLTLAFLRAANIPARAVSAYAWKLEPPDMHAVAEVFLGGRWWLMDSTCLAPVEGLVRVATGLDAADIAFMSVFGEAELLAQSFSVVDLVQGSP